MTVALMVLAVVVCVLAALVIWRIVLIFVNEQRTDQEHRDG